MLQEQHNNRVEKQDLENDLKGQENQHLADARAVKMSIISLQDALMEKVNTVEQLVKMTQSTKVKAKELQQRLEATEAAAAQSQRRYEKMLQDEQRSTAAMRATIGNKERSIGMLQQDNARRQEKMDTLEVTLNESSNRGEILKSDAYTKRKEADMVGEQLEKKVARERDMLKVINGKEEDIARVRLAQRESDKEENELRKRLKQAQFENKMLRNQVSEKMKVRRSSLACCATPCPPCSCEKHYSPLTRSLYVRYIACSRRVRASVAGTPLGPHRCPMAMAGDGCTTTLLVGTTLLIPRCHARRVRLCRRRDTCWRSWRHRDCRCQS